MSEPLLCPKCGALVGKHLTRCYQCKTFLMGSRAEDLFLGFLPERFRENPATNLLLFFCALPYVFILLALGPSVLAIIPSYTMVQLGATNSALVLMDQYWRFVTANFVHFNALHILMNGIGLISLGPLIERMFDYKKCFVIFIVSGTLTFLTFMAVEFALPNLFASAVAGGASAGLFGLLGAGVAGANKYDIHTGDLRKLLLRNFVQNLVLGLIILPLGSNVLHVFGFIYGYGLAYAIPGGEGKLGRERSFFSYAFLACFAVVVGAFVLQALEIRKYPISAPAEDFQSRLALCLKTEPDPKDSAETTNDRIRQGIAACDIILRQGVNYPLGVVSRLSYYAQHFQTDMDPKKLRRYADRMERLLPTPER